jgi:hypothetical protein
MFGHKFNLLFAPEDSGGSGDLTLEDTIKLMADDEEDEEKETIELSKKESKKEVKEEKDEEEPEEKESNDDQSTLKCSWRALMPPD